MLHHMLAFILNLYHQYFLPFKFYINIFYACPLTLFHSEDYFSMLQALNKCLLIGIIDTHMLHIDDCSELRKIILEFNAKLNYCLGNFTFFSSEVTDCILYVKTINIYKNKKKANTTKMTSILIVM